MIKGISLDQLRIGTVHETPRTEENQGVESPKSSKSSFGEMFSKAINEVDALQKEADGKIETVVTQKGGVMPHEAMIALEKADLAFQLMNQVRAKIVRAYEEVMRTQV